MTPRPAPRVARLLIVSALSVLAGIGLWLSHTAGLKSKIATERPPGGCGQAHSGQSTPTGSIGAGTQELPHTPVGGGAVAVAPGPSAGGVKGRVKRPTRFPSMEEALAAARHAVQPVLDSERFLEENREARFFAHNPGQAMVARFYDGSVRMQSSDPGSQWRLEVRRPGSSPVVASDGPRVEYHHADGVVEWYDNLADGIQHGFVVPSRRKHSGDGQLRMRMDVSGLTAAEDPTSPGDLRFTDGEGTAVAAYRGLKAWDARGKGLPAEMRPASGGFEIAVNDTDAIYPVTIDPYFLNLEQQIMTEMAGTGASGDQFGTATALDGDTAVVTARLVPIMNVICGRAYVFVREASLWSLQAELWPDDGASGDDFGSSVDLDGDTLVIGARRVDVSSPSYTSDVGRVYVFRRQGETWTQQAKLTAPSPQSSGNFGNSVSLQGDELLVGSYSGGAYWFTRSAGAWQFQGQPQPSTGALAYGFGNSVALDGDSMVIGAPREALGITAQVGAAYFFTRSGGTWVQTQRIASPYTATQSLFASNVALDGNTAIIGSPYAKSGSRTGLVDVYQKDGGGTWTPEAIPNPGYLNAGTSVAVSGDLALIGSSNSTLLMQRSGGVWSLRQTFSQGPAVAIDGTTLLLGAYADRGDGTTATASHGTAFVYEFDGSTWLLRQRLTTGNARGSTGLGNAVAMKGNTLLVGASTEVTAAGGLVGAAYVFIRSEGLWQQQARLVSDLPAPQRYFGRTVALDGDTAVIGCPSDSHISSTGVVTTNVGSVIVFTRTGSSWSQQQKVYASDFASSDNFSSGLAVLGDHLLVGSPTDSDGPYTEQLYFGSVYWFQRSGGTWTQKSKFRSGDAKVNQRFGCSIAMDGSTAVIGAFLSSETVSGLAYSAGQAFVFTYNGSSWVRQAVLQSPVPGPWLLFGNSVAINGNTAIIGAPGTDLPGVSDPTGTKGGVGRCYVFSRSGTAWSVQATLDPLNGNQQTAFGKTMQIRGDVAAVGHSGAVDLFTRSGTSWSRQGTFRSNADPADTSFGSAVALDGDLLAVGSSNMTRTLESIQRSYAGFGMVEVFQITTGRPGVVITQPAVSSVYLPDTSQNLRCSVEINPNGIIGTPILTWSKLSGPGTVSFSNPGASDTHASFSTAGTYIIQCAVTLAGNTTTRTRMVTVGTPSVITFRQVENAYQQSATILRSDQPTWNSGSRNQLVVGRNTNGIFRSVLSFDLRGMPANAIVQDVSLELTTASEAGSGSVSALELRWLSTPFTEGTGSGLSDSPSINTDSGANWQRRSNLTENLAWSLVNPNTTGGDLLSSVPGFNAATETGILKTFASTPDFLHHTQRAVISGQLDLVLRATATEAATGDNFARIHSDDAADRSVRPRLRITYTSHAVPTFVMQQLNGRVGQAIPLKGLTNGAGTASWSKLSGPGSVVFSDPSTPAPSVTFDQAGDYQIGVSAANDNGEVSATFGVQVLAADPSFFGDWQRITWPGVADPAVISHDRDPDGDGLNNMLEWALHLDARAGDAAASSLVVEGGMIEYRYKRRRIAAEEGMFQVEWSDDLSGGWSSDGIGGEDATVLTETMEEVVVGIPVGIQGRRFIRLRVTRP